MRNISTLTNIFFKPFDIIDFLKGESYLIFSFSENLNGYIII